MAVDFSDAPFMGKKHVVKEMTVQLKGGGSAHIMICDDACRNTTPEETERILERCAQIYYTEWINGRCKSQHGIRPNGEPAIWDGWKPKEIDNGQLTMDNSG